MLVKNRLLVRMEVFVVLLKVGLDFPALVHLDIRAPCVQVKYMYCVIFFFCMLGRGINREGLIKLTMVKICST